VPNREISLTNQADADLLEDHFLDAFPSVDTIEAKKGRPSNLLRFCCSLSI